MALPPLEFFFDASQKSLEDLELSALNRSANLSKSIKIELETWVDHEATARFARWMIDNREQLLREALSRIEIKPKRVEFLEAGRAKRSA